MIDRSPGRVAQWESARLTRERSLVRTQPRPSRRWRLYLQAVEGASEKVGNPADREKAVDVAIAEFGALRAEIVSHVTAQAALVGLALTAAGVIVGFTVKEGADQRLLLAIPPLTLLVVLLHTAETFRAALIGRYIAVELWGDLEGRVGKLSSWEAKVAQPEGGYPSTCCCRRYSCSISRPCPSSSWPASTPLCRSAAAKLCGGSTALRWCCRSSPRSALPSISAANREKQPKRSNAGSNWRIEPLEPASVAMVPLPALTGANSTAKGVKVDRR